MAIVIRDKQIDKSIEDLVTRIKRDYGINNCSKTDAIRFLLQMKKQGKKTNRKWKDII